MTNNDANPLLTPIEVATFLQLPIATIYAWRHKGHGPPGIKVGRHVRYRREAVLRWLADQEDAGNASRRR